MSRSTLGRGAVAALCAALLPVVPAATASAAPRPPGPPSDAKLAQAPARHDLTREQFYFVMPDRFADGDPSNNRGGLTGSRLETGYDPTDKGFYQGGDLKGLTNRLDYIKGLGTTAIWLAPIFKNRPVQGTGKDASVGYHGYWITDFTRVDPHFGTNADLTKLIDKAHAKGMKVFFDVITNHTADTVDYDEKAYGYRPKGAYPYLDKDGRPFDDSKGLAKVDADSFPYTPGNTANDKVPAWLNDPTMYHNRGDSTFMRRVRRVRRLLRAGRSVDRTARGRDRHGKDLREVGPRLRHRRLPDRHRQTRRPGFLDPVGDRPGHLRGRARPQGLLHVRRGLLRRHRRHLALRHPG